MDTQQHQHNNISIYRFVCYCIHRYFTVSLLLFAYLTDESVRYLPIIQQQRIVTKFTLYIYIFHAFDSDKLVVLVILHEIFAYMYNVQSTATREYFCRMVVRYLSKDRTCHAALFYRINRAIIVIIVVIVKEEKKK